MIAKRRWCVFICALFAAFFLPMANSQDKPELSLENSLRAAIAVQQALPPAQQNLFSGALNNWLSMAHTLLDKPATGPDDGAKLNGQTGARMSSNGSTGRSNGDSFNPSEERNDIETVSSSALDMQASHLAGFTQSTTSTAWCGHNVVTGFNSTVATVQTFLVPAFNGINSPSSAVDFAYSRDDGESFTDPGFLNPGPFPNSLLGNPVLACANSQRFYFATSPFGTGTLSPDGFTENPLSAVGVSVSNDGGKDWGNPIAAVTKNFFHLLDKAWLTLDPRNGNHVYVTYTDFDTEGFFPQFFPNPRCPGTSRSAIELVSSTNGGQTWSAPTIVQEACHPVDPATTALTGPSFTGSQIAIGKTGKVYVSYLSFATDNSVAPSVQLKFRRSDDQGTSFGPEVNVTDVTPTGCCAFVDGNIGQFQGFLQGFFQALDFPSMAVDTRGKQDVIYLVWADGRDNSTIDVLLTTNTYNFGDILLSKSVDGGDSWTSPFPISPTPRHFEGAGRDQFQPGIAINEDGKIAVCYNDRRNDPANNAVDHYCSFSEDGGNTFRDVRQTTSSWVPVHGSESQLVAGPAYMGDYDGVAAHVGSSGEDLFFSGFQIIKNVIVTAHGRSSGHEQ